MLSLTSFDFHPNENFAFPFEQCSARQAASFSDSSQSGTVRLTEIELIYSFETMLMNC